MKNLKTKTSRIAAVFIIVLFAFSAASLFAGRNNTTTPPPPAAQDLLMSFNETLDSNTTLDGNIILTGAISDRGTRHEDFSVVSVNNDGSQVVVTGTSTITTASGTITTKFTGTIYFDNATFNSTLLAYVEGTESVTGGTGAYAGVSGKPGTFEATLDYTTGGAVGVFEAKVQLTR
jgi:hypothetical protein